MDASNYEYRDETGKLLYTIVRHGHGPAKSFDVFGPRGGVLPNPLPDAKRVLYRLPELLAAPAWETIFLPEGEKDSELLVQHGMVATTMPFGSRGGWLTKYNAALLGRHMVVLPDNDGPGKRHVEAVSRQLEGVCASVLVLSLGGSSGLDDVSTWFPRQSDPAGKLLELVRKARFRRLKLSDRAPPRKLDCVALTRAAPVSTLSKLMMLLLIEALHSGERGRYCRVADLARDCGVNRVTAQNSLQQLQRLGIVPAGGVPQELLDIRWDLLAAMSAPAVADCPGGSCWAGGRCRPDL